MPPKPSITIAIGHGGPGGDEKAEAPPNLRDSEGEQYCGNCDHYGSPRMCNKFHYPVTASQLCDEYQSGDGMDDSEEKMEGESAQA